MGLGRTGRTLGGAGPGPSARPGRRAARMPTWLRRFPAGAAGGEEHAGQAAGQRQRPQPGHDHRAKCVPVVQEARAVESGADDGQRADCLEQTAARFEQVVALVEDQGPKR